MLFARLKKRASADNEQMLIRTDKGDSCYQLKGVDKFLSHNNKNERLLRNSVLFIFLLAFVYRMQLMTLIVCTFQHSFKRFATKKLVSVFGKSKTMRILFLFTFILRFLYSDNSLKNFIFRSQCASINIPFLSPILTLFPFFVRVSL